MTKKERHKLWDRGAADAKAGKPIEAFYALPKGQFNETRRAVYEMGYRATKREMEKSGHPSAEGG